MLKLAIFVFREGLEIALLLGIIMAVTKPIKNSRGYVILGAMLGVVFAAVFAIGTREIAKSYGGVGDELFNSAVIMLTSIMISWTVVWMQGHTKKMKQDLGDLSDKIISGSASGLMLIFMVSMSILREGSEIILYVYSAASLGELVAKDYIIGLGTGGGLGLLTGTLFYMGLIRYAGKYIFKVSSVLLTLIAAGLAAQSAGLMTSAGIIELYTDIIWDISHIVDNNSVTGKLLNATTGYDSRPNGLQIIFYVLSIVFTYSMIKIRKKLHSKDK